MMFDTITNFEINTVDIWDYEHRHFNNEEDQIVYIPQLMVELEDLIYTTYIAHLKTTESLKHKVEPFVCGDEDEHKSYYERHVKKLLSKRTLEEKVKNGFFELIHNGTSCIFSYRQNIEIKRTNKYYTQWFRIKLKQFKNDLQSVSSFLDFQFEEQYDSKDLIFTKFLNEITQFYISSHFSADVLREVKDYLEKKVQPIKELARPMAARKNYQLKALIDNPNYFRDSDRILPLIEIFKELKKQNFILKTDELSKFQKLLGDQAHRNEGKLTWIGYRTELKWFIQFISTNNKFEKIPGREKWDLGIASFYIRGENGIEEFRDYTQISRSTNDKNNTREVELRQIIERFNTM